MHLILTGGGTAGHVMPNIALIECFLENPTKIKISYIGSKNGLEKKLLKPYPVKFYSVSTGKLRRYFDIQNLFDLFKVPIGFVEAFFILKKIKPNLVFSKGGFVALPVVLAAKCLNIPIIVHESDSIPGLTTRITGKLAQEVWADNPNIAKQFGAKFHQVSMPIRQFLYKGDKNYFFKKYNFNTKKQNLLVMGGSLGASAINDFIYKNLQELTQKYNILHICGKNKSNSKLSHFNNYVQVEYLDEEISHAYAFADLVLTRAGASALAELSALNLPSILVPLPKSQSRGEQIINANEFVQTNKGVILTQSRLNYSNFENAINKLSATKTKDTHSKEFSIKVFDRFLGIAHS
jgi:UDP-N-acetylglucosamine--N-acetylmuramyl-(pentapeptide) pyrophosphoryl-undecaprenol N-acetylglucosamine transferase